MRKLKTQEEKFMNIAFKFAGTMSIILAIMYAFKLYEPTPISIIVNMLLIGLICLFAKYTPNSDKLKIKIKYFNDQLEKIQKITKGDWIDLRSSIDCELKEGEFKLIPLGVAMELPEGYEAEVKPRSSTFKNFSVIQTNSVGCVDESYCGSNDQWFMPIYALKDTKINMNDRICQFRIIEKMPEITFIEVEQLENEDRGGHGSTGKN